MLLLDLWRHAGQQLCFLVLSLELFNTDALDSCQVSFSLALLPLSDYRCSVLILEEVSTEQPTWSCSWISQLRLKKLVLKRHLLFQPFHFMDALNEKKLAIFLILFSVLVEKIFKTYV